MSTAVLPDGSRVYVANAAANTVTVMETATNTVIDTIPVGVNPVGLAVHPDGTRVYVTNAEDATVSVIETAGNTVIATVPAGQIAIHAAAAPDGVLVYVTNRGLAMGPAHTCAPDINGALNILDFVAFQGLFMAGCP